jgi:hypothetical protein
MKAKIGTLIAAVLLIARTASATPITMVFDSSLLFGLPGTTVTFVATVTDIGNSSTYLNGDDVTVDPPMVPDDLPFFSFPPILGPLQFMHAPVLNIFIPLATPAGLYSGTLQVTGGTSAVSLNVLATQSFAVQVQAASGPVPEPISGVLVLSGGAVAALRHSRRRRVMGNRAQGRP